MIAWAAVIFAFSSVPSLGTDLGTWDLILRKAAHLAEYAILGALLARATRSPVVAVALAGLYAVSDEVHQTFVDGRVGAPLDVAIDTLGARSACWPGRVSQAAGDDVPQPRLTDMERLDLPDRQLDALLERLDRIAAQLEKIDQRLEASEGLVQVTRELRALNDSLNAVAYAALGQSPQVRRRAG